MNYNITFKKHKDLTGLHATLSPSGYAWLRYDSEKLITVYQRMKAKELGTKLHEYAHQAIILGRKQPRNDETVNMFINDAIGFGMQSEQPLFYSEFCFGTADAISFKRNVLRIHDLKTGDSGHMDQLMVYAALFCLEYEVNPKDIKVLLRIYKHNEIEEFEPQPEEVQAVMDIIISHTEALREFNSNS